MSGEPGRQVSVETVPNCDLCGSESTAVVFSSVPDRLHGIPGRFTLIKCESCGMVRLSPRPAAEALGDYYPGDDYNAYKTYGPSAGVSSRPLADSREAFRSAVLRARGYDEVALPTWAAHLPRRLPGWLVRRASYGLKGFPDWVASGRALDVGCGNGQFLAYIRRHGWNVEGIDLSPTAAEVARTVFDVPVQVGTLDDVGLPSRSFDFVHMSHVIEHVISPARTLGQVASLLRPGGRVYIETPNIVGLGFRWSGRYWYPLEVPRHLWLFSPDTLSLALHQAGLRVRRIRGHSLPAFHWEQAYRYEERAGKPLPRPRPPSEGLADSFAALRSVERRERPRAAVRTVVGRVASRVSPRFGDVLCCWAELPR